MKQRGPLRPIASRERAQTAKHSTSLPSLSAFRGRPTSSSGGNVFAELDAIVGRSSEGVKGSSRIDRLAQQLSQVLDSAKHCHERAASIERDATDSGESCLASSLPPQEVFKLLDSKFSEPAESFAKEMRSLLTKLEHQKAVLDSRTAEETDAEPRQETQSRELDIRAPGPAAEANAKVPDLFTEIGELLQEKPEAKLLERQLQHTLARRGKGVDAAERLLRGEEEQKEDAVWRRSTLRNLQKQQQAIKEFGHFGTRYLVPQSSHRRPRVMSSQTSAWRPSSTASLPCETLR